MFVTKQKLLTCLICFFSVNAHSQFNDTAKTIIKNRSIESMSDYVGAKLSLSNEVETFSVHADPINFELYPNTSTVTSLSLNYRIVSFSANLSPKFINGNNDNSTKGKTKSFGLGLGFNLSHWLTGASYNKTKGYYLQNTSDFQSGWKPGDAYLQVPGLKLKSFDGYTGYSFNNKFSRAAITSQTERQLKSAGSFIPIVYYRYFIIDDTDPGTTQKTNNFRFLVGAGYHYNFVINEQFYIYGGAVPAVGYIFTRLLTRDVGGYEINHQTSPIVQLEGRVGGGYNGERFFAGGYLTASTSQYRQEHTTVINDNSKVFYQVFLGYRFRAPKVLSSMLDEVDEKIKKLRGRKS